MRIICDWARGRPKLGRGLVEVKGAVRENLGSVMLKLGLDAVSESFNLALDFNSFFGLARLMAFSQMALSALGGMARVSGKLELTRLSGLSFRIKCSMA